MALTRSQKARQRAARYRCPERADLPEAPVVRESQPSARAQRPTPERMAKGSFRMPKGALRQILPAHDEHHDCVAAMHKAGLLTDSQEASARVWQELRADVLAEIGVKEARSCLDMTQAGYDSDDGNPDLMRRWREIEIELGSLRVGILDWTVLRGHKPIRLSLLQSSLDILAGL